MHKKISIEQSKISDGINFVENGLEEIKKAKKQKEKQKIIRRFLKFLYGQN